MYVCVHVCGMCVHMCVHCVGGVHMYVGDECACVCICAFMCKGMCVHVCVRACVYKGHSMTRKGAKAGIAQKTAFRHQLLFYNKNVIIS